jgi:hypothetical protein
MSETCQHATPNAHTSPKKKGPPRRRPVQTVIKLDLFQRSVDRVEHGVQVATKAVDRSKDRNRNARCDQTVFNSGSAGLVGYELQKAILQNQPP